MNKAKVKQLIESGIRIFWIPLLFMGISVGIMNMAIFPREYYITNADLMNILIMIEGSIFGISSIIILILKTK